MAGRNVKWHSHGGKIILQFLLKLKMNLLYDPAIELLGIYTREMKTCFHTETCT